MFTTATDYLPSTKTVDARSFVYVGNCDTSDIVEGTVHVTDKKKVKGREVTRSYAIQETTKYGPFRCFFVMKDAESGQETRSAFVAGQATIGEVYECRVHSSPNVKGTCTCKAGRVGRTVCLHVEMLTNLVRNGVV